MALSQTAMPGPCRRPGIEVLAGLWPTLSPFVRHIDTFWHVFSRFRSVFCLILSGFENFQTFFSKSAKKKIQAIAPVSMNHQNLTYSRATENLSLLVLANSSSQAWSSRGSSVRESHVMVCSVDQLE